MKSNSVRGDKRKKCSRLFLCLGLIVFTITFVVGCGSKDEKQGGQDDMGTIEETQTKEETQPQEEMQSDKETQSDKQTQSDVEPQSNENTSTESWGPQDRDTYTWDERADLVVFNSITDNPKIGDERNFVRIREAGSGENLTDKVELEVGKQYEVAVWYDNNAKPDLNGKNNDGVGIATDVRIRIEAPEIVKGGTSAVIKGFISSTNSNPEEVWDTAYAHSETTVLLHYVANSATFHSNGDVDGVIIPSEDLFGSKGTKVGYWNDLWGSLPGGSEYSGYLTFLLAVDQPGFEISSTVAIEGEGDYTEKIIAKPGDILDFHLLYKNTGTMNQLNIIAYDTLPKGLKYITGSSYFTASFNETGGSVSDKIVDEGINLGDFEPGDWGMLTYRVQVEDDIKIFPSGDTVLYNDSSIATANGTGYDKVQITIHRD